QSNGFVDAVILAYNKHHNLVIRPDDIWIAIVLQFSRYVNANAEGLRHKFVAHEGQKELKVDGFGTLETADFGKLATQLAGKLKENVTDPDLYDWIMPAFSTTTANDSIVGSVALMTAMQKYFRLKMSLCCGIPNVTLLGTKEDWIAIQTRVVKLAEYGPECAKWSQMLSTIATEFVATVSGEGAVPNVDFWQKVCHYTSTGSGPTYLSGWISAFCVFSETGEWQGDNLSLETWNGYKIDGLQYPVIDSNDVPTGYATVDVIVDDNGVEHACVMFVGHTGFEVVDSGVGVQPKLCWAMAVKN
ncbi:hypothetical protein BC830DRAFT_1073399, partial [Chytriomyces sp. MP71]